MKHLIRIIFIVGSLLIALNAHAEDKGFYVGGAIGYSSADVNQSVIALAESLDAAIDDDDLGWKLFAGYNLNSYFSAELGYVDLGEGSLDMDSSSIIGFEIDGFAFSGIATYPINKNFDVFGKLGAFVWETEYSSDITSITADDDGTNIMFGLGAEYKLKETAGISAAIRAEWERYDFDDDNDDIESADLFSIGLIYSF